MENTKTIDQHAPTFYIGQHESKRALPVTDQTLNSAQECGYDMLTTPITTPYFHNRVLALLSKHLYASLSDESLPPIIPALEAVDTPLTPGEIISQLVGVASAWTDICSPDQLISNLSRQVLKLEVAYAAFCGIGNIIIPGPKLHHGAVHGDGLAQYARAIQEALNSGTYTSLQIHLPMTDHPDSDAEDQMGALAPFARLSGGEIDKQSLGEARRADMFGTWDAWNVIRTTCKYSPRLSIALSIPRHLPPEPVQSRWYAEPLRLLIFPATTFLRNKKGYPVLGKTHQQLLTKYMRLRTVPWILLCDVGPIPNLEPVLDEPTLDGHLSPSIVADARDSVISVSPEGHPGARPHTGRKQSNDAPAQLSYMRHLEQNQPPRTTIERFGSGYQDFLQSPLQPLTDNLESVTYEVFEKDPIKYDWYERAIAAALVDWTELEKPASGPNGRVVVAVAGAGRGPLITRALRAADTVGTEIDMWAVEKNPSAYVLLQRHNAEDWDNRVSIVKSDMRSWKGPTLHNRLGESGKVDILISELLGSFGDNELSPECLDGISHVLSPDGISIPASYTAHITPISTSKLHSDILLRTMNEPEASQTPYVVMLHALDYLSTNPQKPDEPVVKQTWSFSHPARESLLLLSAARESGAISGGGLAGGEGVNEHNARYSRTLFPCTYRGSMNGFAGFFETVLYDGGKGSELVELSTNPITMARKSKDMISWFPMFFPLKTPLYFPDHSEVAISIWRQTDDRMVWYEWLVEAFLVVGPNDNRRVRVACSELHSCRKTGCLM